MRVCIKNQSRRYKFILFFSLLLKRDRKNVLQRNETGNIFQTQPEIDFFFSDLKVVSTCTMLVMKTLVASVDVF